MSFLAELERQLSDIEPLHRAAEHAVSMIQNKIHQGKFTPNSSLTAKVKKGSSPLSDTGDLKSSIHYRLTSESIIISSDHPGAAIHHFGGEIKAKKNGYLSLHQVIRARFLEDTAGV